MRRQLVMGDLHGCSDALRAFDLLLALDSWLTLVPLRGNHDLLMHQTRSDQAAYRRWQRAIGVATLRSYAGLTGRVGTLADVPTSHWQLFACCRDRGAARFTVHRGGRRPV